MAESIISKRCQKCKTEKPLSEFYRDKRAKNGHTSQCKSCLKMRMEKYSKTPKGQEAHRKAKRKYKHTPKGKVTEQRYWRGEKGKANLRRYRNSPKGHIVQKHYKETEKAKQRSQIGSKKYRRTTNGKIKVKQYNEVYWANNPEKQKAHIAVTTATQSGRLARANTLQCACGKKASGYHHYLGYEPEHWLDVIPACSSCHKNYDLKMVNIVSTG